MRVCKVKVKGKTRRRGDGKQNRGMIRRVREKMLIVREKEPGLTQHAG